jgi:GNAT superfamily N-acetyltransferase
MEIAYLREIAYLADYPDFAPTLAEWHYQEWNRLHANDSVARRLESLRAASNWRQIPSVLVAIEDGILCGSATLAEYDMETRRDLTPWMTDVFVAPEFRRRGIASALVLRIMREAKAIGVPELYLFTTGPWRERLYAGLGWSVVDRPIYLAIERVLMTTHP